MKKIKENSNGVCLACVLSSCLMASLAFLFLTAGCLHTKIEGQGWKMNRWQFFERQEIGTVDVATNGVLHVGPYATGVDTNGLDKINDIVASAVAAAVKAGLVGALAMQAPQQDAFTYGRPLRVQSVNGKPGPYDLQFVPVADDQKK